MQGIASGLISMASMTGIAQIGVLGNDAILSWLVIGALPGILLALVFFLLWQRARAARPMAPELSETSTATRAGTPPGVAARRKQEATDRTTEVLIRQGLPAARLGGWERDLATNRMTWSEHIHEIFGRTPETMPANFTEVIEIVHPDDRKMLTTNARRLQEGGAALGLELRVLWPDGTIHWQAMRAEVVNDADGVPIRVIGIAMDITERKRIEDELRQSQRLLRVGFDAARIGAWEWDQRTGRVTWSGQVESLFGLAAGAFPGTFEAYQQLVHPDDLPTVQVAITQAMASGAGYQVEHRVTMPDGDVRWLAARGDVLRGSDGQSVGMAGVVLDITSRRLAEQELRDSEERYRTVISAMHEGVVIHRPDGTIIDCNASAEQILGLTHDQLVGVSNIDPSWRTIREDGSTFPASDHPNMVAQRTGQPQHGVILGVHRPDGTLRWLSVNADPLRPVGGGVPLGAVATFRDITDHLNHERALRESEQRLRSIAEHNPNTIAMVDRTGTILYVNRTAPGLTSEQVLGTNVRDYVDQDSLPGYLDLLERVFSEGHSGEYETRVHLPTGQTMWTLNSVGPLRSGGRIIAAVVTSIDITERRRDQDDRQRLQAERTHLLGRLQMHIARMPVAYFVFDEHFRIREMNPAAERMFGFSASEVLGLDPRATIVPSDLHHVVEAIWSRLAAGDMTASGINDNVTKDGRRITCEWINTPLFEDGRFVGVMSMAQDISQRLMTERAMRESEERWRSLAENVPDTILLVDRVGTVLFLNHPQEGMKSEGVLGSHISEVMPAPFSLMLSSAIDQVFTKGEVVSGDLEVSDPKHGQRWFSCHISPVHLRGRTIAATLRAADITERRQAENERRKFLSERETLLERLQLQMERMPIGCIEWGANRAISYANPAAEQIFAYASGDMVGLTLDEILLEEDRPEIHAYFDRLEQGDMGIVTLNRNVARDEQVITCEWHPTPLFDAEGRFTGVLTMVMDVGERESLEEQLRQSQKMEAVGRLAGGIAHDFNNLLTAIMGYGELLESRIPSSDQTSGYVQQIKKAAKRAASLTYQLLAFSRKQVLQSQLLVVGDIITELEPMLDRLIGEHITLRTDLEKESWQVLADAGQLEQVVMNLVVNARDAMPSGGSIVISTRNRHLDADMVRAYAEVPPGDYVMMTVADTGEGMEDRVKRRIFEPFFTTKPEGKGTGLGLAVVFGVVRQSGGFIFVDSVPGKGSRFEVLLPRADKTPEPFRQRDSTAQLAIRGTETILLVEDDDGVRGLAKDTLEASGYTVLAVSNGDEALEISAHHSHPIDLLLTDVVMPGLGGREVAERVRQQRPAIKVLFMSGYTDDLVLTHGVADGTAAFIEKPFAAPKLLGRIRKVLSGQK
jgi:two-component system, cell cycle sensor histidine kinase and response regulator CckA